jgi:hypothetical protein
VKFSIRDLLLVTVIVALAVGWWIDHRNAAVREAKLKSEYDEFAETSATLFDKLAREKPRSGFEKYLPVNSAPVRKQPSP